MLKVLFCITKVQAMGCIVGIGICHMFRLVKLTLPWDHRCGDHVGLQDLQSMLGFHLHIVGCSFLLPVLLSVWLIDSSQLTVVRDWLWESDACMFWVWPLCIGVCSNAFANSALVVGLSTLLVVAFLAFLVAGFSMVGSGVSSFGAWVH